MILTRHFKLTCIFCLLRLIAFSQSDTNTTKATPDIFDRIAKSVKDFKLDTTAAPDDKITRKIVELRNLKGGFNINEAIEYKLQEDKQKGEISDLQVQQFSAFMTKGNGKKWLDNAVIWIYRQHFTFKELKQLVKFYKSQAGQKMSTQFPVIMIQSLMAAETIKDVYSKQKK